MRPAAAGASRRLARSMFQAAIGSRAKMVCSTGGIGDIGFDLRCGRQV